jgi:hypothetical protein
MRGLPHQGARHGTVDHGDASDGVFSVWDRNKEIIYVDTMSVSTYDVWQVQSPKIMM